MRLSLIQTALTWENPTANLKRFNEKLRLLKGQTDLVLLPEMFSTGFSMNPKKIAVEEGGKALDWMKKWAAELDAALVGSLAIKSEGSYRNRLYWVFPNGTTAYYDKRHLFSYAKEHEHYTRGENRLLIEWRGWEVFPLVCYDLRFPAWSRNVDNYDLLIYVANWPKPRIGHWDKLLAARAIENQSYVAALNIVGQDGNNNDYVGHSQVLDFQGDTLAFLAQQESVVTVSLDKKALDDFRNKYNFLADKDNFQIF